MPAKKTTYQEYTQWLSELKSKIRDSQLRAGLKVNAEMLALYWELGRSICEKQTKSNWGDKIITQLATDLSSEFQDSGFSRSNLFNIRKFYQFYSNHLELVQHGVGQLIDMGQGQAISTVQQDVGQFPLSLSVIPWGHHIQIFTKCKTIEEALFYVQQTVRHNWKRTILVYNIESGHYYRKGKAHSNFELVLPKPQSELAQEILKNPYNIGYLGLTSEVSERQLENAILAHVKKFLLELGTGFSFYSQQFHLQVSNKDYYVDLLFYHTKLHCYFAIELKVVEFEPEQAGKLEFYITAIDEQLKAPEDNPTIGLLLCKTADKVIVEYSLKTKTKPMGVAEYKHVIPKEWKKELPDVHTLKQELEKEILIPQNPVQEKINRLKEIIQNINLDPADLEKDNSLVRKIYTDVKMSLVKLIDEGLEEIKSLFQNMWIASGCNNHWPGEVLEKAVLNDKLAQDENIWMLGLEVHLETFIQGGTKAFSLWKRLEIHLDKHKYGIGPNRGQVWKEKVYRQLLSKEELEEIAARFVETIIDEITEKAESIL